MLDNVGNNVQMHNTIKNTRMSNKQTKPPTPACESNNSGYSNSNFHCSDPMKNGREIQQ